MPVAEKVKKKGKHKTAPSPEQEETANGNAVCLWANNTAHLFLVLTFLPLNLPYVAPSMFSTTIIKTTFVSPLLMYCFCFPLSL